MAIERVKNYFRQFNIEHRIIELKESSATVELAALALGCEGKRIAKTLSFKVDNQVLLVVCAGDAKIDNVKFKDTFGVKPKMLSIEEVEPLIGHDIGGVCPFGINEGIDVYLDCSLKRFDSVYPACGSSNSAIELTLDELNEYSKSIQWVDVCKNWE